MDFARLFRRRDEAPAPDPAPPYHKQLTLAAGLLAAVAGYINAVTIAGPLHVATTHMSGTATRASIDLVMDVGRATFFLDVGLIVAFVLGASMSGAILDSTQLRLGRRYGVMLVIEASLLTLAWLAFAADTSAHLLLVALAAGLQNSMATQLSRAIVRTTHMTGILTDLGIAFGKWLSRRGVTLWRVMLYVVIFGGFALGGISGAAAWLALREHALLVPIAITGGGGAIYWALRQRLVMAQSRSGT